MNQPIIITEEYWANSQLSLVRRTGSIRAFGGVYTVVNKEGVTVFELSTPGSKHYVEGNKIIAPGEPCDLVLSEWIPVYKALGRERMFEIAKEGLSLEEAKKLIKHKGNEQRD